MNAYKNPLLAESWNVAWRKKNNGDILDDRTVPFQIIRNSFRCWAADPFIIEYKGHTYIFAELYDYIKRHGVIGYCEITGSSATRWKVVISEKYHLSFPYLIRDGNDIYIMPESSESGTLYLYKAVRFPDMWEKDRVLRTDVQYADTILLENDKPDYALTYKIAEKTKPEIWFLDFTASGADHRIDTFDVGMSRPAGRNLRNNTLRVAQDSRTDYGKGLVFYRYQYNNGSYAEEHVEDIYIQDLNLSKRYFMDGIHTYNYSDEFEVIDIKTRRFNILDFLMRVKKRLGIGT